MLLRSEPPRRTLLPSSDFPPVDGVCQRYPSGGQRQKTGLAQSVMSIAYLTPTATSWRRCILTHLFPYSHQLLPSFPPCSQPPPSSVDSSNSSRQVQEASCWLFSVQDPRKGQSAKLNPSASRPPKPRARRRNSQDISRGRRPCRSPALLLHVQFLRDPRYGPRGSKEEGDEGAENRH